MKIDPAIFGMYDIRGVYGENLNPEISEHLGKAIGTFFNQNKVTKVFVGRDNRLSGPEVKKNFCQGLLSTGLEIIDLGLATTPMLYYCWYELKAPATVVITASHNPAEYNGFKIGLHQEPLYGQSYEKIKQIATKGQFVQGKGSLKKKNIWPQYLNRLTQDIKLPRKLKLVIDSGNGTTGLFVKELFQKLGCEIVGLYLESDGSFPNHPPYPQKTEFYKKLIETIKKEKADLGLAFDGDGDRIGIFNENGEFIANDILTILFTREILKNHPDSKIVMNISTSLSVIDDIKNHGGKLILWKTGYPFIIAKMKEVKAIFGGEISGHFFFKDRFYGADDAFYATIRVLEILAKEKKPISQLFSDIPQFFTTPEFRISVPEEKDKFTIIKEISQEIKKEFPQIEILDFDGVRFSFPGGWGLIRASNTQPMLTGRAEARSKAKLTEIKKLIKEKLAKHGLNLNWDQPLADK